jgi:hypothetical protein
VAAGDPSRSAWSDSFPKGISCEQPAPIGLERSGGQGGRLTAEVRLAKQDNGDVKEGQPIRRLDQRVLRGDRTENDGGNLGGAVGKEATGFVGGVGDLAELLREGEIGADEDIDVPALCSVHSVLPFRSLVRPAGFEPALAEG